MVRGSVGAVSVVLQSFDIGTPILLVRTKRSRVPGVRAGRLKVEEIVGLLDYSGRLLGRPYRGIGRMQRDHG